MGTVAQQPVVGSWLRSRVMSVLPLSVVSMPAYCSLLAAPVIFLGAPAAVRGVPKGV
jgi:hypothetical protein